MSTRVFLPPAKLRHPRATDPGTAAADSAPVATPVTATPVTATTVTATTVTVTTVVENGVRQIEGLAAAPSAVQVLGPPAPRADIDAAQDALLEAKLTRLAGSGAAANVGRAFSILASTTNESRLFSPHEFPNFFVDKKWWAKDIEALPRAEAQALKNEIAGKRKAVEAALGSIFSRLTLPVVLEDGRVDTVRIFPHLQLCLDAAGVDDTARIFPSGGVVRSALGLLYHELREAALADPNFDVAALLARIAAGNHPLFDDHGNVAADMVRGVGSDFDVLVDSQHPERFGQVERLLSNVLNSASQAFAADHAHDGSTKAVFSIADIRPNFDQPGKPGQTARSVSQGGSTLDFLIYDLAAGTLVEPAEHPSVVHDFLLGVNTYAPPIGRREDPAATALRGTRALLEMPFLRLRGEEQLSAEIDALTAAARRGEFPQDKALEQIAKMFRNARESGANNRIHRSPPEHPLSRLKELVEVVAHAKKKKQLNTTADLDVPVYARTYPLERPLGPLPDWMRDAVMSPEEFADGYLRGGRVFHGTQRVDWALSILRGGFRETTYAQGVARGTYMSPDRNLSSQYANAKQGGFLLELELREGIRPNVFTLSRCAERVEKELGPEAEAAGIEIADLLAAKYGFDVIVLSDSEMLMKNPSILEPMKLHTIVRSVGEGLRGDGPLDPDAAQRFIGYHGLHPFAHALGHGDLPPLPQTSAIVRRLIEGFDPKRFFETLMAFYAVQQSGLMDDKVRREVNAFVATRTHWTDLEMGQFAGHELTQFLDDETLLSLLRSPPPITDPAKFVFFVSNLPEKAQKLLTSEVRSLLTPELVLDVIGRASHSEFALSTLLSSSAATPELCHALAQRCDDGIALAVAQGDVEEAFILLNHLFTAYEFAEVEISPETQERLDALLAPFIEDGKVDFFVDPARMGKHNGYGVSLLSDSLADVLLSTLFERALENNLAGYRNIFFWRALQIPAWSPRLLEGVEALMERGIIPAGFLPRFQKRLLV